jgi:hypothetical protein
LPQISSHPWGYAPLGYYCGYSFDKKDSTTIITIVRRPWGALHLDGIILGGGINLIITTF